MSYFSYAKFGNQHRILQGKNYTETLLAIKSDRMHQLLTDQRQTDSVKTAFALGEDHYATIDTQRLTMDALRSRLGSLGHSNLHIKKAEPTIEDCLMSLQR